MDNLSQLSAKYCDYTHKSDLFNNNFMINLEKIKDLLTKGFIIAMKKTIKSRKRPINAEDLFKLELPLSVAMSPDENNIAYTLEIMDKEDNKYYSNLHVYDINSKIGTQYTNGKFYDSQPTWSSDGKKIAFISTRDKKTAIYTININGGAELKIMELDASISNLQWSPDNTKLYFCLRYNDSHYIKDEKKKEEAPVFRHITKMFYKYDGAGFIPKDTFQVYSLDIITKKLLKLTKGNRNNVSPNLSPDGRWIVYVSNRHSNPDVNYQYQDLFIIPSQGGKEKMIAAPAGPKDIPAFSPDGKSIAYIGHDNPEDGWGITNLHVWKAGVSGKFKAKDLMPDFDRMTIDQSITDSGEPGTMSPIIWSKDGKRIFFLSSDTGTTNLYYVPSKGGKPTRIFKGKCHIKAYSVNGMTKNAALVYSDLYQPGQIITCPTNYSGEKKVASHTNYNSFLKTEIQLSKTKDVLFKSFDGTEIQGWIVYPPNFNPKKKYPSILEIHGGPRVQYAYTFFHEMFYLASKGYVVFYTNPRGGAGRGKTWAEAIFGGWGELDYQDCMAAADYLEKQKYINPKRMGVTGGSYGGYMTNWIIGHTNRFKAAVTQRSVVDLRSFFGSSDIGWSLKEEFRGTPWDNSENYEKCSPITYFKNVKTPVLIIHSEHDLRCNIEQAEQMYIMLKYMNKTVEMVRFPEEPHGLSRHGRPDRRIARLNWISKWFKKYM